MTEIELLKHQVKQVRISHKWMLADIKERADELNPGNYSDQLLHAIAVEELLAKDFEPGEI